MRDLQTAAITFHQQNPQVWALFVQFANQAVNSGKQNFGVAAIWERMRWEVMMTTNDPEFKLNNNYRAYYARWFMRDYPQYDGFFRTRTTRMERQEEIDARGPVV